MLEGVAARVIVNVPKSNMTYLFFNFPGSKAAWLVIMSAAAACQVGAATLYVSPQGSDRNSGRGVGPH